MKISDTDTIKYYTKRFISRYLPKYKNSKEMVSCLRKIVTPFMREKFADKPFDKRLIIASMGWHDAKTEAIYAKALEAIGYETYILTGYNPFIREIFKIFGINNIEYYEDFYKKFSLRKFKTEAENYVRRVTEEDILKLKRARVQVGKYAASSFMRITRNSSFNLKDGTMKSLFIEQLGHSLKAQVAVEVILEQIKPDLVWVIDRGYTPIGQLFDACLKRSIPVISRNSSHKSGWEIVKRYSTSAMDGIHPQSLSAESWRCIKKMPWSDARWQELYNELEGTYRSGDWFSEVGTQFNKVIYSKGELISKLKIDSTKKTAVIFPHMFWDATFFWGKDLFKDYYDWFVNVLKIAAKNTRLNWIIKIHPANIVKAKRDNYRGGHRELVAIYEILGEIPSHIKIISPESDINTFSLFRLMDYCLTVRGTVGIEASAFGITTLTAGTGRYDRLGFTYDFDSKEDCLKCIASLQDIPAMTEETVELARRFAYGIFILRPIQLDLLEHGYNQDEKGTMRFLPLFKNRDEFEKSNFVREFRNFVSSGAEDYLNI